MIAHIVTELRQRGHGAAELNEAADRRGVSRQRAAARLRRRRGGKTRVITYRIANLVVARARPPLAHPRRHLHQQGRRRDARASREAGDARAGRPRSVGRRSTRSARSGCACSPRRSTARAAFVIYDATDQKAVVTRVLRDMQLDDRRYTPKAVLGRIHKEKQEGRGPGAMSLDSYMDDAIQKAYRKRGGAPRRERARLRGPHPSPWCACSRRSATAPSASRSSARRRRSRRSTTTSSSTSSRTRTRSSTGC